MEFVLMTLVVLLGASAHAQLAPLPAADWQNLLDATLTRGKRTDFGANTTYYLQKGEDTPGVNRDVRYFSLIGSYNMFGSFEAQHVSTVNEVWTSIDGAWQVEQVIRKVNLQGVMTDIKSRVLVIRQGFLESSREVLVDPNEALADWWLEQRSWSESL